VLRGLAEAAAAEEHLPAELRYRMAAVELFPEEAETLREMARALERGGRFDDARDWWQRLAERVEEDAEACERLGKFGAAAREREFAREEQAVVDIDRLLIEAQQAIEGRQFDEAERLLKLASGAGGGDLRIREAWEELSLRQSEHRLTLAREQAAADPARESAGRLVAQLTEEHARLWLGILHSRSERFPQDKELRLELARQLKRMGNYSGAVQRLEEVRDAGETGPAALIELGECWQHLRQFAKALGFYEQAIAAAAEEHEADRRHLALYRGAVLAEALGQTTTARGWLEQLVAEAGQFKDAVERLDKLRRICDKNGFPADG
jgi:tetratricopeptide (TPR) repeat protein